MNPAGMTSRCNYELSRNRHYSIKYLRCHNNRTILFSIQLPLNAPSLDFQAPFSTKSAYLSIMIFTLERACSSAAHVSSRINDMLEYANFPQNDARNMKLG